MENNINKINYKTQNAIGINIIGFILSTMAGWIDTIGVRLFINQRSASMTGRGHILGYWIYKLEFKMFIGIFLIIIAFITGAWVSTIIIKKTGLTGSLLFTGILIIIGAFPFILRHPILCTVFLPMAMGCQNAATSLTEIKRTTHLTGAATEIGINIANSNWKVVRFWIYRWIGFPLGAIIGFALVDRVNSNLIKTSTTLIIPAIIIIVIAILQRVILNIPLLDNNKT